MVAELSVKVLDGLGKPVEWALQIVAPIFKWVISRTEVVIEVKLYEHVMVAKNA